MTHSNLLLRIAPVIGSVLFSLTLAVNLQTRASAQPKPTPPPIDIRKKTLKPPLPPTPRKGRSTLAIDTEWSSLLEADSTSLLNDWQKSVPALAEKCPVPHQLHFKPGSKIMIWFWREIDIPPKWKGQTIRLRFGAVAENSEIWWDGTLLGAHKGGATPFEYDISTQAKPGYRHLLALRVEASASGEAGILQSVQLVAHDEAYLKDVFVKANGLGAIQAEIKILNTGKNSGDCTLDASIIAKNLPEKTLKKTVQNLSLTPNLNLTTLLASLKPKNLMLWSPETPMLYRLQLSFRQEEDILDTTETTFGFREFGTRGGGVTLNGVPFIPISSAFAKNAPTVVSTREVQEDVRSLLVKLKKSGFNLLYVTACNPALLEYADSEGMLIVEGGRPAKEGGSLEELRGLMERDRSHPCLFAWDVRGVDEKEISALRALDPTRFFLTGDYRNPKLILPGSGEPEYLPIPKGLAPNE